MISAVRCLTLLLSVGLLLACGKQPVGLGGRPCDEDPCLEGFLCDPATQRCVEESRVSGLCLDDCAVGPHVTDGACLPAGGTAACKISSCVPGWSDTDGEFANGCEVCAPRAGGESCDAKDDDCDGVVDEDDAEGCRVSYADADEDGAGDPLTSRCMCDGGETPLGRALAGGDCDDDPDECGADCGPGVGEACDGWDNDCDDLLDEENATGCTATYYVDVDGDNWGTGSAHCLCGSRPGFGTGAGDCDDGLMPTNCGADCHPMGLEYCDGADNDCEGGADEAAEDCTTYREDPDGDGYAADDAPSMCACAPDSVHTTELTGDCSETTDLGGCGPDCNPGVNDSCTGGVNDDCSGGADDGPHCPLASVTFTTSQGLPSNDIRVLALEPDGDLWIGTAANGGLARIPLDATAAALVAGLESKPIAALALTPSGAAWVGYVEGSCDSVACSCGPSRVTLGGGAPTVEAFCTDHMSTAENYVVSAVAVSDSYAIFGTGDDLTLYLGGGAGDTSCDIQAGSSAERALQIVPGSSPLQLWVAKPDYLRRCTPRDAGGTCQDCVDGPDLFDTVNDDLSSLAWDEGDPATDTDDRLWVGSDTLGLVRYLIAADQPLYYDTGAGFPSDQIQALVYDEPNRRLFVGTGDIGLWVMTIPDNPVALTYLDVFGAPGDLPSDNVQALAFDAARSVLWVGTAAGLVQLEMP